ncbi:MAG: N-acetylmuramoyl-L-alanine amidase [Bacteroidota bacterium]
MKLKKILFLLILMKICLGFAQIDQSKIRIVIDPGHGGLDPGAIGINRGLEKNIVLDVAKEIVKLNKSILDDKFDIYLTRYGDTFVSLSDRSELAVVLKADLFVSLHCNASKNYSQGMEIYVYSGTGNKEKIKQSISLGFEVIFESNRNLGIKNRGVKFANFQVLRETINYCPSILIETGFISDKDESGYLSEDSNVRAVALVILLSIKNSYIEIL